MAIQGKQSALFRYVYSNGFGIQTGGSEVILSFGLKENPQDNDTEIVNEIAVIMLPTTLKFLAQSLTKLVEFMEKASGTEIPFDASKIAALEKAMSEATISSTASPPPS